MTYNDAIKNALGTVGVNYYHTEAHKQTGDYIVWQEKKLDVIVDGHALYNIEVHHYTKNEYSSIPVTIINALRSAGFVGVSSAVIEFLDDTGVTHTVITCSWGANGDETVIALVKRTAEGSDDYGAPIWSETSKTVTGIIVGRKWSELYHELAAGLKPEITLHIYADDYNEEKVVQIGNVLYQITDAHTTDAGVIEIICEDIAKAG